MPDRLVSVYDASILYSAQLWDFLGRLALREVACVRWTEQIHEEWTENVKADYPDITKEDVRRIRDLMNEALSAQMTTAGAFPGFGEAAPDARSHNGSTALAPTALASTALS